MGVSSVLLIWDKRVVEVVEECAGTFLVANLFKNVVDDEEWAFVDIFGPNLDRDRRRLWEKLVYIVYGMYRGVWEVISTSPASPTSD